MLVQPMYALDLAAARRLVGTHGRATIVTAGPAGLLATYGFCLLEEDDSALTVVGHIARADPQAAELAAGCEALLVFDGPHGYVSASWYRPVETLIPSTWNYSAVHLHGRPEELVGEEAFDVLRRTLERHEGPLGEDAFDLTGDRLAFARRLLPGTLAFRLRATSVEAKAKLSQDKPAAVGAAVIDRLAGDGPYAHPALAEDMRRVLG